MKMPYDLLYETVALGLDLVTAFIFYKLYRSKEDETSVVSGAVSYTSGDDLKAALEAAPNKCIGYAFVAGETEIASRAPLLKSHFTDVVGVVRHELFVEHKSKRINGFWSNVRRIIKDVSNVHPFCIVTSGADSRQTLNIEVTDPLSADFFLEHLPVTYDRYEATQDGFVSRAIDRLFGELTKGYQETERMLGIGVPVVGFGMLRIDGKRIVLCSPEDGKRYIVTTLSKHEVLQLLRSDIRTLKVCFWIVAVFGAGIFGYIVYRLVQRQIIKRNCRQLEGSAAMESDVDQSHCVVCMSNPREVVILDCGHVCLCSECATILQQPRLCPICRAAVIRYVPIYIS